MPSLTAVTTQTQLCFEHIVGPVCQECDCTCAVHRALPALPRVAAGGAAEAPSAGIYSSATEQGATATGLQAPGTDDEIIAVGIALAARNKVTTSAARSADSNIAPEGAKVGSADNAGLQVAQLTQQLHQQQQVLKECGSSSKEQQLLMIQQLQQQQQVMLQMLQAATGGASAGSSANRTDSSLLTSPAAATPVTPPRPQASSEITPAEDDEIQQPASLAPPTAAVVAVPANGHALLASIGQVSHATSPITASSAPEADTQQLISHSSTVHSPAKALHSQQLTPQLQEQQQKQQYISQYDHTTEYDPFTQTDADSGTSSSSSSSLGSLLTAAAAALDPSTGDVVQPANGHQQQQQPAAPAADGGLSVSTAAGAGAYPHTAPPTTAAAQYLAAAAAFQTWRGADQQLQDTLDDDLDALVNDLADDQSSIAALTDLYVRRASLAGSEVEPLLQQLNNLSDDLLRSLDEQHYVAWQQQQQHTMNREQRLLHLLKHLDLSPGGHNAAAAAASNSPGPTAAASASAECFSPRYPGTPGVLVLPPPSSCTATAAAAADQAVGQEGEVQGNTLHTQSVMQHAQQQHGEAQRQSAAPAAAAVAEVTDKAPSVSSSIHSLSLWDRSFLPSSRLATAAAVGGGCGTSRRRGSRHNKGHGKQQVKSNSITTQQQQDKLRSSVSKWCSKAGLDWELDLAAAAGEGGTGNLARADAASGVVGSVSLPSEVQQAAAEDGSTLLSDSIPDQLSRVSLAFTDTCWPQLNNSSKPRHPQQQQAAAARCTSDSSAWVSGLLWPVPEDKVMLHSPGQAGVTAADSATAAAALSSDPDVVGLLLKSLAAAPAAAAADHKQPMQQLLQQQQLGQTGAPDVGSGGVFSVLNQAYVPAGSSSSSLSTAHVDVEQQQKEQEGVEHIERPEQQQQQQQQEHVKNQQRVLAALLASTSTVRSLTPNALPVAATHHMEMQQQQLQQQEETTPARSLLSALTLSPAFPGQMQVYHHNGTDNTAAVTAAALSPEQLAALMQNPLFEPVERLINSHTYLPYHVTAAAVDGAGIGSPGVSAAASAAALGSLRDQQWDVLQSNISRHQLQNPQGTTSPDGHTALSRYQQHLMLPGKTIASGSGEANMYLSGPPTWQQQHRPMPTAAAAAIDVTSSADSTASDVLGRLLMDVVELNRLLHNCNDLDAAAVQQLQELMQNETFLALTQHVQAIAQQQQQQQQQQVTLPGPHLSRGPLQQHNLHLDEQRQQHELLVIEEIHPAGQQPPRGQQQQAVSQQVVQQQQQRYHQLPPLPPPRRQTASASIVTDEPPTTPTAQTAVQHVTGLAPLKTPTADPLSASGFPSFTSGDNVLLGSPSFNRASRQVSSSSRVLQELVQGNLVTAEVAGVAAAAGGGDGLRDSRSVGWLQADTPRSTPLKAAGAAVAAREQAAAAYGHDRSAASSPITFAASSDTAPAAPSPPPVTGWQGQGQQQHLPPGSVLSSSRGAASPRSVTHHIYEGVAASPVSPSAASSPCGQAAVAASTAAPPLAPAVGVDAAHQAAMAKLRDRVRQQLQLNHQPTQYEDHHYHQQQVHAGKHVSTRKVAATAAVDGGHPAPAAAQSGTSCAAVVSSAVGSPPHTLQPTAGLSTKGGVAVNLARHQAAAPEASTTDASSIPSATPAAHLEVPGDSSDDDLLAGIGPAAAASISAEEGPDGPDSRARRSAGQPGDPRSVSADSVESLEALSLRDLRELLSRVARASLHRLQKQQQQQPTDQQQLVLPAYEAAGDQQAQVSQVQPRNKHHHHHHHHQQQQQQQLKLLGNRRISEGSSAAGSNLSFRHLAATNIATAAEPQAAVRQEQLFPESGHAGDWIGEETPRPRGPLQQQPVIRHQAATPAAQAASVVQGEDHAAGYQQQLQQHSTFEDAGSRSMLRPPMSAVASATGCSSLYTPGSDHRTSAAIGKASLVQALQMLAGNSPNRPSAASPRAAYSSPTHAAAAGSSSVCMSISPAGSKGLSSPGDQIQLESLSLSQLGALLRAARHSQQRKGQSVPDELVSKSTYYQQCIFSDDKETQQMNGLCNAGVQEPGLPGLNGSCVSWPAAVDATVQPSP